MKAATASRPTPYRVTITIEDPDGKRTSVLSGLAPEAVDLDVEYEQPARSPWNAFWDMKPPAPRTLRLTLYNMQVGADGRYLTQTNTTKDEENTLE